MIIVSAFNKGGVGKTTLAVHLAGILSSSLDRTLLIDCVDQHDAWDFFLRQSPMAENEVVYVCDRLSIIWNPDKRPLRQMVDLGEYDHTILDINSPNEDTVQTIADNHPNLVLLPINDQALGLQNLKKTLAVIAAMEQKAGYLQRNVIVPLGVYKHTIEKRLLEIEIKPDNLEVASRIRKHPAEFSKALETGHFVWEFPQCADVKEQLTKLL